MVRHLGLTGHHRPEPLVEAIRRFPFDAILLALNAADPHHYSFVEQLLPLAVERQMGIVGMKITSRGRILSSWTPPRSSSNALVGGGGAGAGPRDDRHARSDVLHAVPAVSTAIIGCDNVAQLEENVELARAFTPLSEAQMRALVERTRPVAKQALFFGSSSGRSPGAGCPRR